MRASDLLAAELAAVAIEVAAAAAAAGRGGRGGRGVRGGRGDRAGRAGRAGRGGRGGLHQELNGENNVQEERGGAERRVTTVEIKGSDLSADVKNKWGRSSIQVEASEEGIAKLLRNMGNYIRQLLASLTIRMTPIPILHAFAVLEPEMYRKDDVTAEARGADVDERFGLLVQYYGVWKPYMPVDGGEQRMAAPLVDGSEIMAEKNSFADWMLIKSRESNSEKQWMNLHEIWEKYRSTILELFPNIFVLFQISLVLPLSNAVVERVFSTMNDTHTIQRNSLHIVTVDAIMMVNLEGPGGLGIGEGLDREFVKEIYKEWMKLPKGDKWGSGAHEV